MNFHDLVLIMIVVLGSVMVGLLLLVVTVHDDVYRVLSSMVEREVRENSAMLDAMKEGKDD
ncbi:MAG: hypothetical protein IRZ03_12755 [Acidobacterium ailaaui]|nr:hypothetical protein [Pseudacidobacterium ailaaui]